MTLRTIQKLCRLLSVGSIICLIGSLITSSSSLLYLGVIGTFAHGWLNLRLFRCPYCRGRLVGAAPDYNCPHCGQPLNWG